MNTSDSDKEKRETAQPARVGTKPSIDRKRRSTTILIIIGVAAAIGLYFLSSWWHPFWRYQPGYVSEAQFGQDWPFSVSEAKVVCIGPADMLLETRAGVFGLTSHTIAIGYKSLEDSTIWKWDPNGWNHRVPADKFWTYVNTLCK